jgi:hemerythrin
MYLIEEVLKKLIDYTKSHFSFEENLMQEAGYPVLESHKKLHQAFIDRIYFFKERFENGENIAKQLKTELQFWLIHHIKHADQDYKNIVQEMFRKKNMTPEEKTSNNLWINKLIKKYFKH